MRIFRLRILSLAILLAVGAAYVDVDAQTNTPKTDREQWDLIGPVAKLRSEMAFFERQGDRLVESERKFAVEIAFDRNGKRVALKSGDLFGDPISPAIKCQPRYAYDEKGRVKEHYTGCGDREKLDRKYSYEEDTRGNWIKQVMSAPIEGTAEFIPRVVTYREITYFD